MLGGHTIPDGVGEMDAPAIAFVHVLRPVDGRNSDAGRI